MIVECKRFIEENKRLREERNKAIEKALDGAKLLHIGITGGFDSAKVEYGFIRFLESLTTVLTGRQLKKLPSEEDGFTYDDFCTLMVVLTEKNLLTRNKPKEYSEVQNEVVRRELGILSDCIIERGFAVKYAFCDFVLEELSTSNEAAIEYISALASLRLEDGRKLSDVMPPVCEETIDEWKKILLSRFSFDKVGHPCVHLNNGDVLRVNLIMILAPEQLVDEINDSVDGAYAGSVKSN